MISDVMNERLQRIRNIGISAHIDSGKTTLTERILYYTGRIKQIHEVRGKDGVGAKMDSMELERERGITIQSAATYCQWRENHINIIDTPGHVDFTMEVERALRVLDGVILVLCGVGGVQSQTLTVDRQMKRYQIPRLCFINKMDRVGADPWRTIDQIRHKLKLNVASLHLPLIDDEGNGQFIGVVDLVQRRAYIFEGPYGDMQREVSIPSALEPRLQEKRQELITCLAEVDDVLAELFLNEREPSETQLQAALRRATLSLKFAPVLLGSAFRNKGIQNLLDAIGQYLPNPSETVTNDALDQDRDGVRVPLIADERRPFVGLGFKLEESRFGQLTYLRIYQGCLKRGGFIYNTRDNTRVKVPRLVRMHANEMEDVDEVRAGDICALFGIECRSGDTFVADASLRYTMAASMFVPQPVMSLAIIPKAKDSSPNFSRALARFQKEDPTFRVHHDNESGQTVISGMGELHLDIYVERMRREYGCDCTVGKPQVAFREMPTRRVTFNYTHKKQTGGAGQFARVIGYIESLPRERQLDIEFVNEIVGMAIPGPFITACEKGFREACLKGPLLGQPVTGVRMVIEDGLTHVVDSSELAFKLAAQYAFRKALDEAIPVLLEPLMMLEVITPIEFQGTVMGQLNKRKGVIQATDTKDETVIVLAEIPLNNMFGYSTELRSLTQGKGEFTLEYKRHEKVPSYIQQELILDYAKKKGLVISPSSSSLS
jgi:elongation factor G